jgi:hypothetical protein
MSSTNNKKFRIQNGAAITGEVTVNDQVVITEAGIVTVPAISAAVASIVASDIATLQSQVDAILGTSPESLNTLQEIVSLFQSEDGDIQTLITNNSTAITAMQATLTSGVATTAQGAKADTAVQPEDFFTVADGTTTSYVPDWTPSWPSGYTTTAYSSPLNLVADLSSSPDGHSVVVYKSGSGQSTKEYQIRVFNPSGTQIKNWNFDVGRLEGTNGFTHEGKRHESVFSADITDTHVVIMGPQHTATGQISTVEVYALSDLNTPVGFDNYGGFGFFDNEFTSGSISNLDGQSAHIRIVGDYIVGGSKGKGVTITNKRWKAFNWKTGVAVAGIPATHDRNFYNMSVDKSTGWVYISMSVYQGGDSWNEVRGYNILTGQTAVTIDSGVVWNGQFSNSSNFNEDNQPGQVAVGSKYVVVSPGKNVGSGCKTIKVYALGTNNLVTSITENSAIRVGIAGTSGGEGFASTMGNAVVFTADMYPSNIYNIHVYNVEDNGTKTEIEVLSVSRTYNYPIAHLGESHSLWSAGGKSQGNPAYSYSRFTPGPVTQVNTPNVDASTIASKAYVDSAVVAADVSGALATASADATTKADAAQAAAISTASADATTKADAAQAAAIAAAGTAATTAVANVIDTAPAALDTLNELAAALGDDANFASTVTASIATKADDTATTTALATKADDAATTTALATKADVTTVTAIEDFLNGNAGGDETPTVESTIMSPVSSDDWGQQVIVHDDVVLVRDGTYMRIYSPNDLVNHLELFGASAWDAFAYDPVTKILMAGNSQSGTGQNGHINFFHLSELIAGTGPKRQSSVLTLDSAATSDPNFGRSVAFADGKFYAAKYDTSNNATPMVHVWNASDIAAQMPTGGSEILSITPITITAPATADPRGYWGYDMAAAGNYFYVFDMFYSQVSNTAGAIFVYNTSDNQLVATLECSDQVKYFVAATENYYAVHWHGSNPTKTRVYQAGTNTLVAEIDDAVISADRMYEFGDRLSVGWKAYPYDENGAYIPDADKGVAIYDTSDFSKAPIKIITGSEHHSVSSAQKLYAHTEPNVQVYDVSSLGGFSLQDDLEALITANTSAITAETTARTAAIAAIPATDLSPYSTTVQTTSAIATAKSEAQSYADQVVASTIDAAPASLDTLNELAAALGDDANFASTITASIATKATAADLTALEAQITGGVATLAQGALADTALQPADIVALESKTTGVAYDASSTNVDVEATLDMQTNAIINVAAPSAADDAATKAYVDAETTARGTAITSAISTASADATTKADQAEVDAKAYADQVIVSIIDGAPASLNTLNELATALGDDANFASTVTASIATKADDATTTAALATKASVTDVTALDDLVGASEVVTDIGHSSSIWNTFDHNVQPYTMSTRRLNMVGQQPLLMNSTLDAGTYTFTFDSGINGEVNVAVLDPSWDFSTASGTYDARWNNSASSRVAPYFTAPVYGSGQSFTFTLSSPANLAVRAVANGILYSVSLVKVAAAPTLDTNASVVIPAINELHAEISAETTARGTAITSAISTASADATTKADAAQAAAQSYADGVGSAAVASVIDAAPASLDTLNELAAALGDDANFASTVTASIATKADGTTTTASIATAKSEAIAGGIAGAKAMLIGGLCITYDPATGTISIDETETAAQLHVASSGNANALGSQSPSHYRIDVYDVNGTIVN